MNLFIIPSSEAQLLPARICPLSHLLDLHIILNSNKKKVFCFFFSVYLQPFSPPAPPPSLSGKMSINQMSSGND